jgi:hypothetical protein
MSRGEVEFSAFQEALRLIHTQRAMLKDAKADEGVVRALEAILRHLHRLPPGQVEKLRGVPASETRAFSEKQAHERSAAHFSLDEVQAILRDDRTSRQKLEAIAIGRFKVPRGSMRSMGNIEQLRETLENYVRNEQAHVSISAVAKGKGFQENDS